MRRPLRSELERLRADAIEERAIVRDDEHGAAVARRESLEPRDRVEIEVVRGLVEEEQIGLLREDDAEVETAALAAGERRDRAREILVREAELHREHRHLSLELVAAREVIAIGHVARGARARGSSRSPRRAAARASSARESDDLREAGEERAQHVAVGGDLVRLAVVGDLRVFPDDGGAGVGLELARDEAKQRRFAGAVRRDDGDALAEREGEGDVLEERVAGVTEAKVRDLEEIHGESDELLEGLDRRGEIGFFVGCLSQKLVDLRHLRDRFVELGIRALRVRAERDEVALRFEVREEATELARGIGVLRRDDRIHHA